MIEKPYLVVRSLLDRNIRNDYKIKKADVIKLGRVKFKVKEIYIKSRIAAQDERAKKMKRRKDAWLLRKVKGDDKK